MAIAVQQREAQRERRARHVATAHIQQPRNRVGRGDQRHVGTLVGDDGGDTLALGLAGLAGQFDGMRQHGRQRRRRAIVPYRVDGIGLDGDKRAAGALTGAGEALLAIDGLQPGVKAQSAIFRQIGGDPGFGRLLRDLVGNEGSGIDLGTRSQRVAAVDENCGPIGQDDGQARRSAETGEPGQALRAARDILSLMFVGAWHHEPVDAAAPQFGT